MQNAANHGEIPPDADLDKRANYLLGVLQGLSVGAKILDEQQIDDIVNMTLKSIY